MPVKAAKSIKTVKIKWLYYQVRAKARRRENGWRLAWENKDALCSVFLYIRLPKLPSLFLDPPLSKFSMDKPSKTVTRTTNSNSLHVTLTF